MACILVHGLNSMRFDLKNVSSSESAVSHSRHSCKMRRKTLQIAGINHTTNSMDRRIKQKEFNVLLQIKATAFLTDTKHKLYNRTNAQTTRSTAV